jgi:hypothetical protein
MAWLGGQNQGRDTKRRPSVDRSPSQCIVHVRTGFKPSDVSPSSGGTPGQSECAGGVWVAPV